MDNNTKGLKGLEIWAKKVTDGYKDVYVKDMSTSFRDGLAFCAIIHHYKPHLIDFESLSKENIFHNNSLAFSTAEKQLGVPALLDAEDMVKFSRPDRLSVITYLSQLHNCFLNENKVNRMKPGYKRILNNKETGPIPKISTADTKLTPSTRHEVCQSCKHRVYLLERLIIDGKLYHRTCFKCNKCNSLLKPGAYIEGDSDGQYECAVCPHDESRVSNGTELEKDIHSEVAPPVDVWIKREQDPHVEVASPIDEVILRRTRVPASPITQSPLSSSVSNARNSFLQNHLVSKRVDNLENQVDSSAVDSEESFSPRGSISVKSRISAFESNLVSSPVYSPPSSAVKRGNSFESSGIQHISTHEKTDSSSENVPSLNSQIVESTTKQSLSDISAEVKENPSVAEDISVKKTEIEVDSIKVSESGTTVIPSKILPTLPTTIKPLKLSIPSIRTRDNGESKSLTNTPLVKPLERTKISFNIPHIQSSYLKSPSLSHPDNSANAVIPPNISESKSAGSLTYLYKKREISARRRSSLESNVSPSTVTASTPVKEPLKLKHSSSFSNDYNTSRTDSDSVNSTQRGKTANQSEETVLTSDGYDYIISLLEKEKNLLDKISSIEHNDSSTSLNLEETVDQREVIISDNHCDSDKAIEGDSDAYLSHASIARLETTKNATNASETEVRITPIPRARKSLIANSGLDSSFTTAVSPDPGTKSIVTVSETETVTSVSPDPETKSTATVPDNQTVIIEDIKDVGNSSATVTVSAETKSLSSDSDTENKVTPFPRSRKSGSMRAKAVVSLNFAADNTLPSKTSRSDDLSPTAVIKVTVDLNPYPPVVQDKPEVIYPDDLNPFGDDDYVTADKGTLPKVEEYPEDLNPFGDDEPIYAEIPSNYDEAKNPFASDDDDDVDVKLRSPSIRDNTGNSLSPLKRISPLSNTSPYGSLRGSMKKRKAPKPPPKMSEIFPNDSSESQSDTSSLSLQLSPSPSKRTVGTPSPQLRKNRPAPPPPPPPSRNSVATKEKKEIDNMKLKSSVSNKKGESSPSSKAKKKRPAPPVPIPPRREVKKIPLNEIQQEMKEIEEKQEELEKQGRDLEVMIRDRDKDQDPTIEEEENIMQLFELVNQKNALFRRQAELMYIKRSQRLEEEQADIEFQIRCLLGKPQSQKDKDDDKKIDDLMQRLTDVVDQRNEIIESIERDRKRELEEDVTVQDHTEMKNGDLPIAAELKESKEKAKKAKHKKDKKKKQKEENANAVMENPGKGTLKRMKWFSKQTS